MNKKLSYLKIRLKMYIFFDTQCNDRPPTHGRSRESRKHAVTSIRKTFGLLPEAYKQSSGMAKI